MRLWVDFNDVEGEDYIWADLDQAVFFFEEDVHQGYEARLFDGVGHECTGTIVEVDTSLHMVKLELDWQTWHSVRQSHVSQEFHSSEKFGARYTGRDLELVV
jgi:hypothetical protein